MGSNRANRATLVVLIACVLSRVEAWTNPDEVRKLIALRDAVLPRGQQWQNALRTWRCPPFPIPCDPCAISAWGKNGFSWGIWEHIACRDPQTPGRVTTVHIADMKIEGPIPKELCALSYLWELDLDGGQLTGPIPNWIAECFPNLRELDLGYNQLTGTIPENLGTLPDLQEFQVQNNLMTGPIPTSLANLKKMRIFWIDGNDFEGPVEPATGPWASTIQSYNVTDNPRLCGPPPYPEDFEIEYECCFCDVGVDCGVWYSRLTSIGAECPANATGKNFPLPEGQQGEIEARLEQINASIEQIEEDLPEEPEPEPPEDDEEIIAKGKDAADDDEEIEPEEDEIIADEDADAGVSGFDSEEELLEGLPDDLEVGGDVINLDNPPELIEGSVFDQINQIDRDLADEQRDIENLPAKGNGTIENGEPGPLVEPEPEVEIEEPKKENGKTENGKKENGDIENGDIENGDIENGDVENGDTELKNSSELEGDYTAEEILEELEDQQREEMTDLEESLEEAFSTTPSEYDEFADLAEDSFEAVTEGLTIAKEAARAIADGLAQVLPFGIP